MSFNNMKSMSFRGLRSSWGLASRASRLAPLSVGLLLAASGAIADELADAKALIKAGDSAKAYELLEAAEEIAGTPEFDYVLGISALDSGRPGIALFALERVLAEEPNHVFARAELVRALLLLGEREEALRLANGDAIPHRLKPLAEKLKKDAGA